MCRKMALLLLHKGLKVDLRKDFQVGETIVENWCRGRGVCRTGAPHLESDQQKAKGHQGRAEQSRSDRKTLVGVEAGGLGSSKLLLPGPRIALQVPNRERKVTRHYCPCQERDTGCPPSPWLLPSSPQIRLRPDLVSSGGAGRRKRRQSWDRRRPGSASYQNSASPGVTRAFSNSPTVPSGVRAHCLMEPPLLGPLQCPSRREGEVGASASDACTLTHTPSVFGTVGSRPPATALRAPPLPRTTPPPQSRQPVGPAHTHARLPPPRPLAHPGHLGPVLPAPGWGLSARAASLTTSTRSQSSPRMVVEDPPPAGCCPGPGEGGGPGSGGAAPGRAGRGVGARRRRSAGPARLRERERAERAGRRRPPGARPRRGRGGEGARRPELPRLPQPAPPAPRSRRAPAAAPKTGGGGGAGGQGGGPWAGRTPVEHHCSLSPPAP